MVPTKLRTACKHPLCPKLAEPGERFCADHKRDDRRRQDQERGSAAQRGYNARWRRYRERFLREHPLCVECLRAGRATPATVVDHIRPHKGDYGLFWDPANHQALCKQCHDTKTAREDGGFGR